jgi:N-acetylglucosamine malate deacetylase 1
MTKSLDRLAVLAIAAHPDDIEFMMAGTLLRLQEAGAELHLWNLANGCCGTAVHDRDDIVRLRSQEAQAAAARIGASIHPPICDDIAIFHEPQTVAKVASVVRAINPSIVLTQSPQDYMEDHQNACRLAITGTFVRGMRNFITQPALPPVSGEVAIYHGLPHGLRDGMRRMVRSGQYVDIGAVLPQKRDLLAEHKSQKEWLDVSQGMDAYLTEMEAMSRRVGEMSGRFAYAEGWRRHSHLGFAAPDFDPLSVALGALCWIDPAYEKSLEHS